MKPTPKQTATDLVNQYRMILMDEDTDCGNEVLCTLIAIKCARVALELADSLAEDEYFAEALDELERM